MNPELKKLQIQIDELKGAFDSLRANSTIPFEVEQAFRARLADLILPTGFASIPYTAITAPTGGAVIDAEGRAAINSLITLVESLGVVTPN